MVDGGRGCDREPCQRQADAESDHRHRDVEAHAAGAGEHAPSVEGHPHEHEPADSPERPEHKTGRLHVQRQHDPVLKQIEPVSAVQLDFRGDRVGRGGHLRPQELNALQEFGAAELRGKIDVHPPCGKRDHRGHAHENEPKHELRDGGQMPQGIHRETAGRVMHEDVAMPEEIGMGKADQEQDRHPPEVQGKGRVGLPGGRPIGHEENPGPEEHREDTHELEAGKEFGEVGEHAVDPADVPVEPGNRVRGLGQGEGLDVHHEDAEHRHAAEDIERANPLRRGHRGNRRHHGDGSRIRRGLHDLHTCRRPGGGVILGSGAGRHGIRCRWRRQLGCRHRYPGAFVRN